VQKAAKVPPARKAARKAAAASPLAPAARARGGRR
jgi:hypothetical protein